MSEPAKPKDKASRSATEFDRQYNILVEQVAFLLAEIESREQPLQYLAACFSVNVINAVKARRNKTIN